MSRALTKAFSVHSAAQFVESITEAANTSYYLFAAGPSAWDDDNNPPTPTNSVANVYFNVYENLIFGKRVANSDVRHMIRRVTWASNTVYDQYDQLDEDLPNKNFFIVNLQSGEYNVFKCLDNNQGAPSTSAPQKTSTSASDIVYKTVDGYQWKYMFSINATDFTKFSTDNYIPVVEDANVVGNAVSGAVDAILVIDGGSRYRSVANGIVSTVSVAGNTFIHELEAFNGANVTISLASGAFNNVEPAQFANTNGINGVLTVDTIGAANTFRVPGTYTNVTSTASGSGVGATFDITVDGTGAATVVAVSVPGGGYIINETLTVTDAQLGANGAPDLTFDVATLQTEVFANVTILEANSTFLRIADVAGDIFNNQSNTTIIGVDSAAEATIVSIAASTSTLSSNTDFYKGAQFYVVAGTGAGVSAVVSEYIVTGSARRVLLDTDISASIDTTSRFEITPRVVITGDGTGAVARALVNTVSGAIANVEVLNRGSGYTYASATVTGNTGLVGNTVANDAIVNCVLSPPGGHGSNAISELYGDVVCVSVEFDGTEGGNIPTDNDYRQIGLLRDPLYANTKLDLSDITPGGVGTAFTDGELITQGDTGATGYVSGREAAAIYVSNVNGIFVTSANASQQITGASSGQSANVTTVASNKDRIGSDFNTFDNRLILGQKSGTSTFDYSEDQLVIQNTTLANGYVHTTNSSVLALYDYRGEFQPSSLPDNVFQVVEQTPNAASYYFLSETLPDLVRGSGEVLYIENTTPITRNPSTKERFRILIDF